MAFETHGIEPVFDKDSKILILGSFPSVKSRESQFFYGHPQNRFWKVLAALLETPVPKTVEDKKHFLLASHIAVWDVIESCEITGSSDSSIRNVTPNRLDRILSEAAVRQIFTNGAVSGRLYRKYCEPLINRPAQGLPSTSPANAAFSLDRLIDGWGLILSYLN